MAPKTFRPGYREDLIWQKDSWTRSIPTPSLEESFWSTCFRAQKLCPVFGYRSRPRNVVPHLSGLKERDRFGRLVGHPRDDGLGWSLQVGVVPVVIASDSLTLQKMSRRSEAISGWSIVIATPVAGFYYDRGKQSLSRNCFLGLRCRSALRSSSQWLRGRVHDRAQKAGQKSGANFL